MTGHSWLLAAVVIGAVACTGAEQDRGVEFGFDPDTAAPVSDINMLNVSRETAPSGIVRVDADVLLPLGTGEATARATLKHVIDSLAAADTMVAAVRVTGFMIDDQSTNATEALVNPVITARWVPEDTEGITGRRRTALYRTHYVILEPLALKPVQDRP